jgi:hypothetical protein
MLFTCNTNNTTIQASTQQVIQADWLARLCGSSCAEAPKTWPPSLMLITSNFPHDDDEQQIKDNICFKI